MAGNVSHKSDNDEKEFLSHKTNSEEEYLLYISTRL
jgi:hypothetical protein